MVNVKKPSHVYAKQTELYITYFKKLGFLLKKLNYLALKKSFTKTAIKKSSTILISKFYNSKYSNCYPDLSKINPHFSNSCIQLWFFCMKHELLLIYSGKWEVSRSNWLAPYTPLSFPITSSLIEKQWPRFVLDTLVKFMFLRVRKSKNW
jgi:hypothetical protein